VGRKEKGRGTPKNTKMYSKNAIHNLGNGVATFSILLPNS